MGSFLDTLLTGALGIIRTQAVASGGTVQANAGSLMLADPSSSSPTVLAPINVAVGTYFGVADATGQSAVHAINVTSVGAPYVLESPASAGTYSNAVTIATAGRVRFWVYTGTGWKLAWGAF